MKRMIKKIAAALSAVLVGSLLLAGCAPKVSNTEADIQLSYWRSGLGIDYLNRIIEDFEEEYPQYNVILEPTYNKLSILDNIELEEEYNTIDLYMTGRINPEYNRYFEPLNSILEHKHEGETKTIGEKYYQDVLENLKSTDGNYYTLSYGGGWGGIVYNSKVIDGDKYKIPRTTDELESLAMQLYDDGLTPFIHFQEGGYWFIVYQIWQMQYDGMDYYENVYLPLNDGGESPSLDILTAEDGRRKVLDVMQSLVTPEYVYNGTNSLTFTEAQTLFVKGQAVMMANGSWLINEMRQELDPDVELKIMKVPVISSIVDNLEETTLSELGPLIDAIDKASAKEEVPLEGDGYKVSEYDRDRVFEARNLMFSNNDEHVFYIPEYSVAKEAAKEFIKFFYRDEEMRVYADTIHAALPVHYSDGSDVDMTDWNEWEKETQAFYDTAIPVFKTNSKSSPIFTAGGADDYARVPFVTLFCSRENDRITAQTAWERIKLTFEEQWPNYLSNAGL